MLSSLVMGNRLKKFILTPSLLLAYAALSYLLFTKGNIFLPGALHLVAFLFIALVCSAVWEISRYYGLSNIFKKLMAEPEGKDR